MYKVFGGIIFGVLFYIGLFLVSSYLVGDVYAQQANCDAARGRIVGCTCTNNNQCANNRCQGFVGGTYKICYGIGGLCGGNQKVDYCDCSNDNQCFSNECYQGTCGRKPGNIDTIIEASPSAQTTTSSATFVFRATKSGATFKCQLETGRFGNCTSPKTYASLGLGDHTFSVRALDKNGTWDVTPAIATWTIGTATPTPTPTPTPTATPTAPPSPIKIEKVEVSENQAFSGNVKELEVPFTLDSNNTSLLNDFNFSDGSPGKKFLFVRFTGKDALDTIVTEVAGPFEIELVRDPVEITNVNCPRDEGGTVNFEITGNNFGATPGIIKSGSNTLELASNSSWQQNPSDSSPLRAKLANAPDNDTYNLTVTRFDGKSTSTTCSSAFSQISIGASYFCPAIPEHAERNVKMTIFDAEKPSAEARIGEESVNINAQGVIERPNPTFRFIKDHYYGILLETPTSLKRFASFQARRAEANTTILNIELPVGDIAPSPNGDGLINALDDGLLKTQWGLVTTSPKSGDFNFDRRVNSFDFACLRHNYNATDSIVPSFPIEGIVSTPPPDDTNPEPTDTPEPTPTPTSEPTPTPTSTPTSTPSPSPS